MIGAPHHSTVVSQQRRWRPAAAIATAGNPPCRHCVPYGSMIHRNRCCLAVLALVAQSAMMVLSFGRRLGPTRRAGVGARRSISAAAARSSSSNSSPPAPHNICIVGGGLAGLSTAFHFLEKQPRAGAHPSAASVTILDRDEVGQSGASAVAGGLVHPLSPRGKLVHLGIEGLQTTRRMVQAAVAASSPDATIVLREEIYRVALRSTQAEQLRTTAANLPSYCQWNEAEELRPYTGDNTDACWGGARLHGGCQVLHVPSYLQGLWKACRQMARDKGVSLEWEICSNVPARIQLDQERNVGWDAVVLAAGAGMLEERVGLVDRDDLPIELVRGQSVELSYAEATQSSVALLSGKYISPLPGRGRVLVGATHEFKPQALAAERVVADLREATEPLWPELWQKGHVERLTVGTRVQSQRGRFGRQPIIGRLSNWPHHENAWIFTGLSSRGLLYHGVFGALLVDQMLGLEGTVALEAKELDWWR